MTTVTEVRWDLREVETSNPTSHEKLHCNCMPRLQPLVCKRQNEEEWSEVACMLYYVLVSPCPFVSFGVVGFLVTTTPSIRSVSRVCPKKRKNGSSVFTCTACQRNASEDERLAPCRTQFKSLLCGRFSQRRSPPLFFCASPATCWRFRPSRNSSPFRSQPKTRKIRSPPPSLCRQPALHGGAHGRHERGSRQGPRHGRRYESGGDARSSPPTVMRRNTVGNRCAKNRNAQ